MDLSTSKVFIMIYQSVIVFERSRFVAILVQYSLRQMMASESGELYCDWLLARSGVAAL
jgi:hypothetical protein